MDGFRSFRKGCGYRSVQCSEFRRMIHATFPARGSAAMAVAAARQSREAVAVFFNALMAELMRILRRLLG
jgi:hypothetical protein